ncbi:uncharacterized protein [Dysidea avara]|uniref:uncharacterized protein n=1 Tax=Dysidea avara TaxID=196820 RepID=UPI003319EA44
MAKLNFLDRFVNRFKKEKISEKLNDSDSSGRLSGGLSRRFNKWRQRSARSLAALLPSLPSRKKKNKVQSSAKRIAKKNPRRFSLISLFRKGRRKRRDQRSAPLSLNDSSSSDESMEGAPVEMPSSDTLQYTAVVGAVSNPSVEVSTRSVDTREEEARDTSLSLDLLTSMSEGTDAVTRMGEGTDEEIVMSDIFQLSSSSTNISNSSTNISNSTSSSSSSDNIVGDIVCANKACECDDETMESYLNFEALNMDDDATATYTFAKRAMIMSTEPDMKKLLAEKPEEKPPPSSYSSDDEPIDDDSSEHDLFIIVSSFIITTVIAASLIITLAL